MAKSDDEEVKYRISDKEDKFSIKSRYIENISLDDVDRSDALIKIEGEKSRPSDRRTTVQKRSQKDKKVTIV
ncbi:hypothetical protein H5410_056891 [Solanum commersonii]|uniref:Uncharacterized protein n=1 Tax=Solanum commersonii TaxID=4109 RepID=A0A9J5WN29_SOLCO|nr:hypothetical protein H5410_056891 [Solanum commersonii]